MMLRDAQTTASTPHHYCSGVFQLPPEPPLRVLRRVETNLLEQPEHSTQSFRLCAHGAPLIR